MKPAQALLASSEASVKDKANVVRLLGILEVVTKGDLSFVEVLMVKIVKNGLTRKYNV